MAVDALYAPLREAGTTGDPQRAHLRFGPGAGTRLSLRQSHPVENENNDSRWSTGAPRANGNRAQAITHSALPHFSTGNQPAFKAAPLLRRPESLSALPLFRVGLKAPLVAWGNVITLLTILISIICVYVVVAYVAGSIDAAHRGETWPRGSFAWQRQIWLH